MKKARRQGALIVNSSQNLKGTVHNRYQAAADQIDNGVISAGSIPAAVLYALLLAILPLKEQETPYDLEVRFKRILSNLKEFFHSS